MSAQTDYRIGAAQLEDVAELRGLAEVCWRATYAQIFSADFITDFMERAYSTVGLRHAVTNPDTCFLVAKYGVALVGFGQVGPAFHAGDGPTVAESDLYRLYLHPDHQRRGLGKRMLHCLEDWLAERNHSCYGCYVHKQNHPAQAFYAAQGFIGCAMRDTDEEFYLVKRLGEPAS